MHTRQPFLLLLLGSCHLASSTADTCCPHLPHSLRLCHPLSAGLSLVLSRGRRDWAFWGAICAYGPPERTGNLHNWARCRLLWSKWKWPELFLPPALSPARALQMLISSGGSSFCTGDVLQWTSLAPPAPRSIHQGRRGAVSPVAVNFWSRLLCWTQSCEAVGVCVRRMGDDMEWENVKTPKKHEKAGAGWDNPAP